MGYVAKEENSQTGEVTRRGPFVTEQEARRYPPSDSESRSDGYSGALGNLVEQAYDFDPQLATANVRQEVEDAVRDGGWALCAQSVLVCAFARTCQHRSRRLRRYGVNSI